MRVYTCTIVRKENRYLLEFVNWYHSIGVTKMFIYDNGFIDEENPIDVLKPYVDIGFVEVVNFRDKVNGMFYAFNDFIMRNRQKYDWAFFIDADEFLTFKGNMRSVSQFLSLDIFNEFDSICVNWECYGDNGHVYYENKPIMERFPKKEFTSNFDQLGKIFVRGGNDFIFSTNGGSEQHYCPRLKTCNEIGEEIHDAWNVHKCHFVALNHYMTKSLEEFCEKVKRGWPDRSGYLKVGDYECNEHLIDRLQSHYYGTNEITAEKIDFVLKKYGVLVTEPRKYNS